MRRYDLDWLRVIVFMLLIFYHVSMFFVAPDWEWHIKNNVTYEWIKYPMKFLNQWRLPILFVISGMGTSYALSKRSAGMFAWERIKRLLLPLIFGMLVIVPPQVYIEKLSKGLIKGSYFDFWPSQAFIGEYPEGNLSWHHLWFIPYLLLFSLVLIPVFIYLRKNPDCSILRLTKRICQSKWNLYWFIVPLYLIESFIEPFFEETHALIGDWFIIINSMTLFFYGFLLISVKETFWNTVEKYRRTYLYCGLTAFSILLFIITVFEDGYTRHFIEAFIYVASFWSWILTLFGYASKYLNKPSNLLNYCNQAVYPFYILHQTVTVILAYFVMHLEWGFSSKFIFLSAGTFLISWIIYEFFIRRWLLIRPLFGLQNTYKEKVTKPYNAVS
ncbi:acyltransferase family protein [Flavobacterium amniphilum]|uniref:acyltransferase family protein n=1 Tax=Flavobacterium amniphilum TaxID=1834035 RepID=UPI002029F11E|nr:acyltransferase family protein [Flavobacterium amniphilum]MCL9806585.1 acyltransferase family protein [Flavobacterium amniphilum]